MSEKFYILDGHFLIYRAYYAPFRRLTSPSGEPTRATYVFCQMLLKLIAEHKPHYLAMAVDGPAEKLHRRRLYGDYKVTRKPPPEDFSPQAERIVQIVRAMHVPILQADGYEADDVMASLVERYAGPDLDIVLVSRDKDLDQLVGPHAVLYDPMKDQLIDAEAIERQKGYPPAAAVEIQTLTGDSTDNIPGIPGIGPKTAVTLIRRYGSVRGVLEHLDELTPRLRENIRSHADRLELSRRLVTLHRDVPVETDLEAMRFEGIDGRAVRPLLAELGFRRLLRQLDELGVGGCGDEAAVDVAARTGQTSTADFDYTCVDTPEALARLVETLAGVRRVAVDTETTSPRPMWAKLVGISLAWRPGRAVYLPAAGPLGARALPVELLRRTVGKILADENVEKVGHNIKYDMIVLAEAGMPLRGPLFDTMIAAHVLDSTRGSYKLDTLAGELLDHRCTPIEELIGSGKGRITMDQVPVERVAPYAAEDADVALRLADVLAGKLAAQQGLGGLFGDLEMPLVPVLAEMERTGIRVDIEELNRQSAALSARADRAALWRLSS
ncbi:MAG: DNA polymerase I, partial [Planctomycetes bacterium]|nr:DNA polymerase I [Planctomycetota bacterium]